MRTTRVAARLAFDAVGLAGHGPLQLDFGAPHTVLRAHDVSDVRRVIDSAEEAAQRGDWVVGWLAYEAAGAFDPALPTHPPDGPLAWFGVHHAPLSGKAPERGDLGVRVAWADAPCRRSDFDGALADLLRAIEAGEVYQVNHTARWHGELRQGHALDLFERLRQEQPAGWAAFIDSGEQQVLSVSPELFFDWDGEQLLTRPMKGTAPRGRDESGDAAQAAQLRASPKERAENVMVVDLLRNDLSRVALPGSVRVPVLFDLLALPTVWQMTSDVTARTRPATRLFDVLQALFPCGSVTGAPKRQAMRRIVQHEAFARGVYCGAIGVLRPGGGATFNVGIRTVVARGTALCLGVGSGITAGSQARAEWREWHHKAAFAARAADSFELLETLLLDDGRWRFEARHRERMAQAARRFGFRWFDQAWHDALSTLASAHARGQWRVRVLCSRDGHVGAAAQAMALPTPLPVRLRLADQPFRSAHSPFVSHKTTRREAYEVAACTVPGVFDTLLWNDDGELTECTRGNVALRLDSGWVTPALHCGLLPGIGRQVALDEGRVREAVVPVSALARVREMAFVNSLRGWLPAVLCTAA